MYELHSTALKITYPSPLHMHRETHTHKYLIKQTKFTYKNTFSSLLQITYKWEAFSLCPLNTPEVNVTKTVGKTEMFEQYSLKIKLSNTLKAVTHLVNVPFFHFANLVTLRCSTSLCYYYSKCKRSTSLLWSSNIFHVSLK